MAALVSLQLGSAMNLQIGAVAPSEPVSGFAAILLGVFNVELGAEKPVDPGLLDPAAPTVPDTCPLSRLAALPSVTVQPPPVAPGEVEKSAAVLSGVEGAAVIRSGGKAVPGGNVVAGLDRRNSDEKVQAQPEDVCSLLSEAVLDLPLGSASDEATGEQAAAQSLAPASTGESPAPGAHLKRHRFPGEDPVFGDEARQALPDCVSTVVGPVCQAPDVTMTLPIAVTTPVPASHPADVPQSGDGTRLPNRVTPGSPGKAQPEGAVHPAAGVTRSAAPPAAAEPEKLVFKSEFLPEPSPLLLRTDLPHANPSEPVASPALRSSPVRPAAPADQIAPALVGILQKADGQQSVIVRLQPAELGQVEIRVDQTGAGAAHIAITAERPETLQMLQRDEPRLQQVLDQAGVLPTGRTVSFQVSPQEQIGATASRPDSMETGAGASGQDRQNGGAWRQNGDSPNDFGRNPDPDQAPNRPRWFRAGLDITA